LGYAQSVETWCDGELVGGLYGVCLGRVFFGESMFSRKADASKIALMHLVTECRSRGIVVIDCQVVSEHLASLGSRAISRQAFQALLKQHCHPHPPARWE
jgi:leucyl/phenylalanyl-tRNA--protein transferase